MATLAAGISSCRLTLMTFCMKSRMCDIKSKSLWLQLRITVLRACPSNISTPQCNEITLTMKLFDAVNSYVRVLKRNPEIERTRQVWVCSDAHKFRSEGLKTKRRVSDEIKVLMSA